METSAADATYPTSLADPPIASTAKGIATTATDVPAIETQSQASRSRKFRLRNGPRNAGIGSILSRLQPGPNRFIHTPRSRHAGAVDGRLVDPAIGRPYCP